MYECHECQQEFTDFDVYADHVGPCVQDAEAQRVDTAYEQYMELEETYMLEHPVMDVYWRDVDRAWYDAKESE